jgi:methionyl-tRNA formyltransferase
MSIVFFGFQSWGLATLRAMVEGGREVALVITHPDAEDPYHRHFTESVAEYASAAGVPVMVKSQADSEVISAVERCAPRYIVSSNWRRVLPGAALSAARMFAFNVHRSMLPRYAGLAPINWAIANGETRVGVTIHLMGAEVDLGDIVAQEGFDVGPAETATEVFKRTNPVVARQILYALQAADAGQLRRKKTDPACAEFFHVRGERELLIDWRAERRHVHNLIRAQSDPFANAYTFLDEQVLKIKSARMPLLCYRGTPSRVVHKPEGGGAIVLCGISPDDVWQGLELVEVALDDGPPQPAADVLRVGQYLGQAPCDHKRTSGGK